MKLLLRIVFALAVIGSAGATAQSPPPNAAPAKGRTLLMVDDHDILYRSGTTRELHPAKRHSDRPLIAMDKRWEVGIAWTSIYRNPDTGKYQLWYQAYAGARAGDKRLKCVVCYAESDDGITFTKPELDLFPYSKELPKTNIVLISAGGYGDRYCNSVIVEPDDPDPAKRYKMLYYDFDVMDGREEPVVCAAFSPDGIRWTKHPKPLYKTAYGTRGIQPTYAGEEAYKETKIEGKPLRKSWAYANTLSDAVDVFRDPRSNEYVVYAKMWMDAPDGGTSWKHGIGRTASKDFLNWSPPQFIIGPDEHDSPEAEFHTMPVFFYNDVYFGLNQVFVRRPIKLTIDVEMMTSRDGYKWNRDYRKPPFIQRPQPGIFDSRSMFTNATPVILDDEIRFYYGAANMAPLMKGVKSAKGELSGVGMASIPRDRFAGIRPVEKSDQTTLLRQPLENIGQVTFKPLDLKDVTSITLNADASKGSVAVELLNEDGYRVRGFSKDDVGAIKGDSLRHKVEWKGSDLAKLPAGRYMLRVHLDNATLYAATFAE
jgi:hypothetical protein